MMSVLKGEAVVVRRGERDELADGTRREHHRDDRDVREGGGGSHGQEGVERTGGHGQGLGDGVGGLDRDGEHDGGALGTGTLQGVFRL